MRLWYK